MKRVKSLLIVTLAAVALVSCGKDNPSEMIAGSYTGYTSAKIAYSPKPIVTDDETMTITASDENANIVCKFQKWGTVTVDKATAKEDGDNVVLSGKGSALVPSMSGEGTQSYDLTFDGKVSKDKSTFEINIVLPGLMKDGTTIVFKNGKAPEQTDTK